MAKKKFCIKCGKRIKGRTKRSFCESCLIQNNIKQKNMLKNQVISPELEPETPKEPEIPVEETADDEESPNEEEKSGDEKESMENER